MMYYYRRKSNPLKWIIIVIILALIGAGIYWFYINYFSKIDFSPLAQEEIVSDQDIEQLAKILLINISYIEGDIEVKKLDTEYQKISPNFVLHQGDKIKSGNNSKAVLSFENDSVIRLGDNTEIELESLEEDNIILNQYMGRTYHNLYGFKNYQVRSLKTVIAALGSKFEVITNQENQYLAVLNFNNRLQVEVLDEEGLIAGIRLSALEKALVNLKSEIKDLLKIEAIQLTVLKKENWYNWNFNLDDQSMQLLPDGQESEEQEEPDFAQIDDSLELAAEAKETGVFLSWSIYNQDDFKSYKIVKSESNQNLKYPGDQVIKSSESKSLNSFLDANLAPDKKYYYRICVLKINDKVVCGNIASIKIAQEEEQVDQQPPISPTLSLSILEMGVNLTWTANQEPDFKEYKILHSISNPLPTLANDEIIAIVPKGQQSYLHQSVNITSVGKHYYRVCSFDQRDNAACSNVKIIEDGQVK